MIDVSQITEAVIAERYAALPDDLASAIDDPRIPTIVRAICADHHLNDTDRVALVEQLVGLVFLGFLHDYDLGKEIDVRLALDNPRLGNELAEAIGRKILDPIRAAIAKNYHPVTGGAPARNDAEPTSQSPHMVDETPSAPPKPMAPSVPAPQLNPAPSGAPLSAPMATPPQPSRTTPKPDGTTLPAPMMLHKESEFAPAKATAKIDIAGIKAPSPLSVNMTTPAPTAARIEIGARTASAAIPTGPTTRVVPPPPGNIRPAVDSSFPKTQLAAPTPPPTAAPAAPKISLGPVSLGSIASRGETPAPNAEGTPPIPLPRPTIQPIPTPGVPVSASTPAVTPAGATPKIVNYSAPAPVAPKPIVPPPASGATSAIMPPKIPAPMAMPGASVPVVLSVPTPPPGTPTPRPTAASGTPAAPPPKIVNYAEPAPPAPKQ